MVTRALDATGAEPAAVVSAAPRLGRAAAWLLGSNATSQALRLMSNLLLTRWLAPDAFGLVAAVNTVYFGLVMFSDLGVWQSVVRSERGLAPRFLGTAWSVQLLRGGLLALVVLVLAWGVSLGADRAWFGADTVLSDPRLPGLLAVFALCALVQGAESMRLACAQRALLGGALARLEFVSHLVAMAVTLALAWSTRSVAALVAGVLAGALARTVLSHWALPGPAVRPCWEPEHLKEIVGFGVWTLASSVIGFLAAHGEKLLLAALLSTAGFGVFSIASLLLMAGVGLYGSLNGHVVFAGLSQALRQGPEAVNQVYDRAQRLADLALGLLAGGLMATGGWVVHLMYDPRYAAAGWMLQGLALGLVALRHQVVEQLMFAMGRPARVGLNNLMRALALAVLVPLGYAVAGERGAVLGVVLSQFAAWPSAWQFLAAQGLWRWSHELRWALALGAGWLMGHGADRVLSRVLGALP